MKTPFEEFFEKENWVPEAVQAIYLIKEKQQITEAWKDGCYNEKQGHPKNAEEYFKKMFGE